MQKSILLVEDDYELSRIFSTFLKTKGLNFDTFLNAKEALQHFPSNINSYSIVLTDFKMEEMNGIDFAKEIRRLKGNIIVIILMIAFPIYNTVNKEEISLIVDKVMMKPFSLKGLNSIISNYLERFP